LREIEVERERDGVLRECERGREVERGKDKEFEEGARD
jgi:hypothetical protein